MWPVPDFPSSAAFTTLFCTGFSEVAENAASTVMPPPMAERVPSASTLSPVPTLIPPSVSAVAAGRVYAPPPPPVSSTPPKRTTAGMSTAGLSPSATSVTEPSAWAVTAIRADR